MKWPALIKPPLTAIAVILLMLVFVSGVDIAAVFFYSRFYSSAAFMVLFGVGGIFAALLAYGYGINRAAEKNEGARRMLVLTLAVCALFFFFVLARIEGGEFGPAFKSYGIGLALGSLLFMKGKVDL